MKRKVTEEIEMDQVLRFKQSRQKGSLCQGRQSVHEIPDHIDHKYGSNGWDAFGLEEGNKILPMKWLASRRWTKDERTDFYIDQPKGKPKICGRQRYWRVGWKPNAHKNHASRFASNRNYKSGIPQKTGGYKAIVLQYWEELSNSYRHSRQNCLFHFTWPTDCWYTIYTLKSHATLRSVHWVWGTSSKFFRKFSDSVRLSQDETFRLKPSFPADNAILLYCGLLICWFLTPPTANLRVRRRLCKTLFPLRLRLQKTSLPIFMYRSICRALKWLTNFHDPNAFKVLSGPFLARTSEPLFPS